MRLPTFALTLAAMILGTFGTGLAQVPNNDTCDLAFLNGVVLTNGLNTGTNNTGATISSVIPSCITANPFGGQGSQGDVWFVFLATSNCQVTFDITASGLQLPTLAVYDGSTYSPGNCSSLPELACEALVGLTGLSVTAGQLLFVQISTIIIGDAGPIVIDVEQSFGLSLSAPLGPGSLEIETTCGTPGATYITAFTTTTGSFPNGWFFGIDIALADLVTQVTSGAPFIGTLDATGASLFTVPAGIPSNLTVFAVTLELNSFGVPTQASPPVLFTTF